MLPQRAACRGDDQAPSEQGRADTKHNRAARELPCHSPKPRELEMLSCSSVGAAQPHACASGLTTRHVRPYCSPPVPTLAVVSLVLWSLVPTSSASVLANNHFQVAFLLPERRKLQQKESEKEFPLFLLEQRGAIYNMVRLIVARKQCPFPADRASLAQAASQQPAGFLFA